MNSMNSLLSPLVHSTFAVENDSKYRMITLKKIYNMAKNIVEIQDEILTKKAENSFSLYISIPFCVVIVSQISKSSSNPNI